MSAADEQQVAGELRFLSGGVTPQDVAAVTAVITAVVAEQSASDAAREPRSRSAWERSQRSLRGELAPGTGSWRAFNG